MAWRSAILIKLQSNFIEVALRHESSPVNLLHIFKKLFPKNTSGGAYQNSWTLDARVGCWLWTLDPGLRTLEARLWTLGIGCWTLDVKTSRF